MRRGHTQTRGQQDAAPKPPGIATRIAGALGGFLGRVQNARDLAAKPTGRLDHTWTARSSAGSRAYEGATQNRSNSDWRTGLTSATLAIIEGLDVMLARSRWMIRNDGYAASAQGGWRRKVVGGGITARASARDPRTKDESPETSGKMLDGYNANHDLLWNAWALDPLTCDQERTKNLYEKQALWMDELFAAGGLLLRLVYAPRPDAIGLAIQELEYEQLNRDLTVYGKNAVYNGIETDQYGAPVAYHVYAAAHPLEELPSESVRLTADGVIHLFRKTRIRQRLGVPMIAAVLPALRNLATYESYTISKARTEAAYHGIVHEPEGSTASNDTISRRMGGLPPEGEEEDVPAVQFRVEDGLFPILRGTQVTFPPPGTPNSVYEPFVMQNLKRISAGTGLDMPTVMRWYADGNFNTQRKAALEVEAETEAVQDQLFINGALRTIRRMFTEIAIREGKLSATGYFTSARWRAAYDTTNWQGPPQKSVDPIKDQAAWDMMYRSLRGTPQEYCNQQGKDIRDILSEWREFFDLADEQGLGDVMRGFFASPTVNEPKSGSQPDGSGKNTDPADAQPGSDPNAGLSRRLASRIVMDHIAGSNGDGHAH